MRNSVSHDDVAYHLHPQTDPRRHEHDGPFVIVSGQGPTVRDAEGNLYLDGMASLWCASLGFADARLGRTAASQMATLATYHCFNHRTNPAAAALAAQIVDISGWAKGKVIYSNSGSDANDTMVRMAWYYHAAKGRPAKRRIISRTGAFHGSTVMGAALSGLPHMHRGFNMPYLDVILTAAPYHYRDGRPGEDAETFGRRLAQDLHDRILAEDPDTIAAMILEPVMGAGGVIVPPASYMHDVARILKAHDILLLSDEVVCGFGRGGEWFGHQAFGIEPDMISMAKALTAGYVPLGAVLLRDSVYQAIADSAHREGVFGHGFTYSGHPLSTAVASEALRIYREMDAPKVAADLGDHLGAELTRCLGGLNHVGEIRRLGFVAGVELVANRAPRQPFDAALGVGKKVERACRDRGVILRNMGDTISICPPLIVTKADVTQIAETLASAIRSVTPSLATETAGA